MAGNPGAVFPGFPGRIVLHDLQGGAVLIAADGGLSLAREVSGKVTVMPAGGPDTGRVIDVRGLPGGEVLIGADKGLFLVREVSGKLTVTPAGGPDTRGVVGLHDLPGGGVLIATYSGLFLAREVSGKLTVTPAPGPGFFGSTLRDLPSVGVLIWWGGKGLFLAREVSGKVTLTPAGDPDTGGVRGLHDLPGGAVLIRGDKGLFLARGVSGKLTVTPVGGPDPGDVLFVHAFAGGAVLIAADKGLFLAREVSGKLTVTPASGPDTGRVVGLHDLPGRGLLIAADRGLFLASEVSGKATVTPVSGPDTGGLRGLHDLPGGGVVIAADKGLFLVREVSGKLTVTPAGGPNTGLVFSVHAFPGGGVVIAADKGLFVAREVSGKLTVTPTRGPNTGLVFSVHAFPGGGVLIAAQTGLFSTIPTSLALATVDIRDRKNLDGSLIDPNHNFLVEFTIAHGCAPSADKLGLNVRVVAPGDIPPGKLKGRIERVTNGSSAAELAISSQFDRPGHWSFQVVATAGGVERPVGEPQILAFVSGPWWERWWKILATVFGAGLASANLVLFGLARRSAWAWRLATDDSWGTWVLRVATLALSHIPRAQLWILDLYFRGVRERSQSPRPFLPLPLTATDGRLQTSTEAVTPPWKGRRLWVQGESGMGKTALFREITESQFRDHETAFAAYAKWDCVLVAFAARDFAGSGEDKDDPAWVIDAVRATLSGEGLTFASTTLLSRFLETGTIGVAIDGLNEVDRTRAVAAFSRTFSEAPMLITSQQAGSDRFTTWRLPPDIRDFTFDLLRLYLTPEQAEVVMGRIAESGLKDSIRSGYDIRLVIDLVRTDAASADLPADRRGLYEAVINAGWPNVPNDAVKQEQQSRAAAAAWRMVSERKPNEDMRRLKPDIDLPANLLIALAGAPEKDNRSVRIVRRVGAGVFEFVHDQMHAYLAARWFAQDGFSSAELEKMVAGSTIWTQSPDARRTLWGFAAALLDNKRLVELWDRIEDKEEWDVLRRALKAEAERRGLRAAHLNTELSQHH